MLDLENSLEPVQGVDSRLDGLLAQTPLTCDHLAETEHLLLANKGYEAAVGARLYYQQVERVATEVQRRNTHSPSSARRLWRAASARALERQFLHPAL